MVVYGHTPVPEAVWVNGTINIDTGCVFGGSLTALRYPERELVSVPARETYYEPLKPLAAAEPDAAAPDRDGGFLDIEDVLGKRIVETRLHGKVTIREENATAALEVMSRWAVDPRWLIYLPPTMSPSETSSGDGLLEHPAEAFAYYRKQGIEQVVCEEKHMGSRAIFVICRDEAAARTRLRRLGGRDRRLLHAHRPPLLRRAARSKPKCSSASKRRSRAAGWWEEFATDWVCLDAEIMPWSAKAQELLQRPIRRGRRGRNRRRCRQRSRRSSAREQRGVSSDGVLDRFRERRTRGCGVRRGVPALLAGSVESIDDLRVAPFHLLASSGATTSTRPRLAHADAAASSLTADPKLFLATASRRCSVADAASEAAGDDLVGGADRRAAARAWSSSR